MLWVLLACAPLQEGTWDVDYSPVEDDSCGLYDGEQALPDTRGELTVDGSTARFELDGTDDDLRFSISGASLERTAKGSQPLDPGCSLQSDEETLGTIVTDARFSAETTWVGTFTGACDAYTAFGETTCTVRFGWTAERVD